MKLLLDTHAFLWWSDEDPCVRIRFVEAIAASAFQQLPAHVRHAAAVATLASHHGDLFDRMLIAQALTEGLTLVTHDRVFQPYGRPVIRT